MGSIQGSPCGLHERRAEVLLEDMSGGLDHDDAAANGYQRRHVSRELFLIVAAVSR